MPGIASAATAVVIGQVAAATSRIRVGAGGIMLPNHAPMVIAEQFGTLESLFPGRIDLGLGRAPGTDQRTMRRCASTPWRPIIFRRTSSSFRPSSRRSSRASRSRAVPGAGTEVPLWILGSSTFGSQLAAMLGLPYAFASHFAPDALMQALAIYRQKFEPSKQQATSYAMAGCNVFLAPTDEEARHLFTSAQQRAAGIFRGVRGLLPPPIDDIETFWSPMEKAQASRMLQFSFVGSPETVKRGLQQFIANTQVDEVMVASAIFDHAKRVRSYELLSDVVKDLQGKAAAA